jgi:peptidoglycan/LPS O-acetylase OafA/YrhL
MLIGYPAMALGAWLIFMSILDSGLAPRWITYLGKISYGLYVFHLLCLYLAEKLLSPHRFSTFFVYWWLGLAMTIALASISYAFFESPFLRLKERFVYVKSRPI